MAVKAIPVPIGPNGEKDVNDHRGNNAVLDHLHQEARQSGSALAKLKSLKLTKKEVDAIADSKWLIHNLVVLNHIVVIAAQPNGGKSMLMHNLTPDLVNQGMDVVYIHADTGGGDAKPLWEEAELFGYTLITPDLKSGTSLREMAEMLHDMAYGDADPDLSSLVLIIDTLKKFADLNSKESIKAFMILCRALTGRGATVALLGHTLKNLGDDGFPVFEGVGDVRADCDDLVYLIPAENADGTLTISTKPDKKRAAFEPVTYKSTTDRRVELQTDYTDVGRMLKAQESLDKQGDVVDAITDAIRGGAAKQIEIIECCREQSISRDKVRKALKEFSSPPIKKFWARKAMERNTWMYSLEPWNY